MSAHQVEFKELGVHGDSTMQSSSLKLSQEQRMKFGAAAEGGMAMANVRGGEARVVFLSRPR